MSDSELDAELLALEGDESSAEEDNTPQSPPQKGASEPKKSIEKSPPRRGVAQKLKSRGRARRARRDESEEEDAFGESEDESPPPPARLPSGSGDELEDEAPLYPIEGKFRSEADRSEIMAMTEIEREEILAERAAEAQKRAQDQQLRRLLQSRRGDDEGKKRKADLADLDDGQRKSSRQKTKPTSKIEEYKRQRELKGAARARGEEGRRKERSPSAGESYSDRDADGESEVEWDDGRRASPPARKDDPPPDLRDFERCRVGRSQFAKYCFYPNFEPLLKNCYVRVNVGMESSGPRYRMCQIKRFNEGRPYVVDGPNNKKIHTNQYIVASNGKNEKEYPFSACSDGKITQSEFDEYTSTLNSDGVRLPTKRQLAAKCDDERTLIEHRFTDSEIQVKITKASKMRKAFDDFNRDRLVRRRDEAAGRGDDATVARCNKELASFDAGIPYAKNGSPVKKQDQQSRLAELNKANRKANSEEIRKALIADKMRQERARALATAKQKEEDERKKAAEEAAKANGGLKVPGDDLFGDASDMSQAGTPRKGRSRAGTPMNGIKEKKVLGQFSKKKMDDEVIASMDLGIDIDI
ncbi:Plus-3 domain-containing protein [Elsinoe fawcettii]|nr:Plus-3 domain-containing protein [Elsinoe fawcettii]